MTNDHVQPMGAPYSTPSLSIYSPPSLRSLSLPLSPLFTHSPSVFQFRKQLEGGETRGVGIGKVREKEQNVSLREERNCKAKRHRKIEKIQTKTLGMYESTACNCNTA